VSIHIINGPNLNLLGRREPEIYGSLSFEDYLVDLRAQFSEQEIYYYQSNHEGDLIDYLQQYGMQTDIQIIFNPAAYTHTSIALADTIAAITAPVIEVHISDTENREDFRRISYLRKYCVRTIQGQGLDGYSRSVRWFVENK